MSESLLLTKKLLRSKIIKELKGQTRKESSLKSKKIKDVLFRMPAFHKAKMVMFYIAIGGEVETKEMIKEAQKLGKIIVVPICRENRTLEACLLAHSTKLSRGPYGIMEPVIEQKIDSENLDLVVVPGLCFDKKGRRLGRGKGYYDRFLGKLTSNTTSVGLAFDFQIIPSVPVADHDVSVNRVIFA